MLFRGTISKGGEKNYSQLSDGEQWLVHAVRMNIHPVRKEGK